MGQVEVFNFLKGKLLEGDYSFFTLKEMAIALKLADVRDINGCLKRSIRKLYAFGYLEIKDIRFLPWRYRLKASCLKSSIPLSPLSKDITAKEFKRLT